jgi:hypothetical protein
MTKREKYVKGLKKIVREWLLSKRSEYAAAIEKKQRLSEKERFRIMMTTTDFIDFCFKSEK